MPRGSTSGPRSTRCARRWSTPKRPFIVEDTVHLGILQFAKFRLWKDLDDNWEELSTNSLVTHLIHSPNEAYIDAVPTPVDVDLDAVSAQVPVSADSSQLEAVVEAVEGRTFVLEGPPGTGKSQTITNLLARSLASGKRVLFVAEKRAALEVVKDRLDAVGLGSFSLDLHDKGARPNAVREQLRAALDATARPDRRLCPRSARLRSPVVARCRATRSEYTNRTQRDCRCTPRDRSCWHPLRTFRRWRFPLHWSRRVITSTSCARPCGSCPRSVISPARHRRIRGGSSTIRRSTRSLCTARPAVSTRHSNASAPVSWCPGCGSRSSSKRGRVSLARRATLSMPSTACSPSRWMT